MLRARGSSRGSLGRGWPPHSPELLGLQGYGFGSFLFCCKNMSGFAQLPYSFPPLPSPGLRKGQDRVLVNKHEATAQADAEASGGWGSHPTVCPGGSSVQLVSLFHSFYPDPGPSFPLVSSVGE